MRRWIGCGVLAVMLAGLMPGIALAGSGGRRNTAIGLTAGALYTWINGGTKSAGRRNTAIGLTAASVVAWHKYKKAKRAERRRAQLARASASRPVSYARGYRSSSSAAPAASRGGAYLSRSTGGNTERYCQGYRAGYRAAETGEV
jgi:hypothetical protein